MARPKDHQFEPRITNRRALHDYTIESKLECGIALLGSEVKSLRLGHAQLTDSFVKIEHGRLVLLNCQIDPYAKASGYTHEPKRPRFLLAHRREIKRLASESADRGVTLVPLSIYFKDGLVKVELAVARGRQAHDKRDAIRKREMDAELRRATTTRR
jgi:SsrA-binding protein